LGVLDKHQLRAALFVCGKRVDGTEGRELLQAWNDSGHVLGNDSYSHLDFNLPQTTYDRFVADFQNNEPVLSPFQNRSKLFRYPLRATVSFPNRLIVSRAVLQNPACLLHRTVSKAVIFPQPRWPEPSVVFPCCDYAFAAAYRCERVTIST
jgi:Polysaccharide deacetylase